MRTVFGLSLAALVAPLTSAHATPIMGVCNPGSSCSGCVYDQDELADALAATADGGTIFIVDDGVPYHSSSHGPATGHVIDREVTIAWGDATCSSQRGVETGNVTEAPAILQQDASRVFYVETGGRLYLERVDIRGDDTYTYSGDGGLLYVESGGEVETAGVRMSAGDATGSGGIAYVAGDYTARRSPFWADFEVKVMAWANGSATYGGAVYVASTGSVDFEGESYQTAYGHSHYNEADYGGFLYVDGTAVVDEMFLFEDSADVDGGVMYVADGGILSLAGTSRLEGGFADGDGGAIFVDDGGQASVEETEFVSNEAGDDGGGIYSLGSLAMDSVSFVDNVAADAGGRGGGLYLGGDAAQFNGAFAPFDDPYCTDCEFDGNSAAQGGAVAVEFSNGVVETEFVSPVFVDNLAESSGGALFLTSTDFVAINTDAYNNQAASTDAGSWGWGGFATLAGHLAPTTLELQGGVIEASLSERSAGAIDVNGTSYAAHVYLERCVGCSSVGGSDVVQFLDNTTTNWGGAVRLQGAGAYLGQSSPTSSWESAGAVSLFSGNSADDGGAIHMDDDSSVELFQTEFVGNSAGTDASAIMVQGGAYLYLTDSLVHQNTGTSNDGAIYSRETGTEVIVESSTLIDNDGYGIGSGGTVPTVSINASILYDNGSASYGGGVSGTNYFVTCSTSEADSDPDPLMSGVLPTNTTQVENKCSPQAGSPRDLSGALRSATATDHGAYEL